MRIVSTTRPLIMPLWVRLFRKLLPLTPAMFVTNTNPGGYWEDQGYNWFGGS